MTVESGATASGELKRLPMPDVGDCIFLFVMWLNLFVIPNHLFEDGSTGWHLVAGDFILNTLSIPYVDLFSNSFPQKAWVAYEWLYDLLMALVLEIGGFKLLAVVLTAAIGFLFLSIYDRMRQEGAGIAMSFTLVIVAILTSAMHWLARPHLVTFLCVWIFSTTLEDFYRGRLRVNTMFYRLCPLMLFWVNCHPAFMLGLVITVIFVVSVMVQSLMNAIESERVRFKQQSKHLLILFAALFAITFINPYGYHLHQYILGYLRGSEILAATDEYLSPVFKGGFHPTCLEILFFAFAYGLYVCQKRLTMPGFLMVLAFGYASLTAQRNMPLYAIVATPYIGGLLARHSLNGTVSSVGNEAMEGVSSKSASESYTEANETSASESSFGTASGDGQSAPPSAPTEPPANFGARIKKSLADFEAQEAYCKMHLLPIAYTMFLVVIAISGGSFMNKPFLTSTFDPKLMPIETTEYVKRNHVDMKHVFNYDNWGGYLRYSLGQRVFIDDRADFYGHDFYAKYTAVMVAAEGWQKLLLDSQIDWVLFPKNTVLSETLKKDKDWKVAAEDQSSFLFQRVK